MMDTNKENVSVSESKLVRTDRLLSGMIAAIWVVVAIGIIAVVVGLGWYYHWYFYVRVPPTAEEKAAQAIRLASVLDSAGHALNMMWSVAETVAGFLANGRIDTPFTVVVICFTVAYIVRVWASRSSTRPTPGANARSVVPPIAKVQEIGAQSADRSWVYFIANREDDTVKIGYSDDPQRRLSELQMGNHSRLEIMALMPGGQDVEQTLHNHFAHLRIDGEWFDLEGDLLAFVEKLHASHVT